MMMVCLHLKNSKILMYNIKVYKEYKLSKIFYKKNHEVKHQKNHLINTTKSNKSPTPNNKNKKSKKK